MKGCILGWATSKVGCIRSKIRLGVSVTWVLTMAHLDVHGRISDMIARAMGNGFGVSRTVRRWQSSEVASRYRCGGGWLTTRLCGYTGCQRKLGIPGMSAIPW